MHDFTSLQKPFALIKRRDDDKALFLAGEARWLDKLDQIPRKKGIPAGGVEAFDSLSILPYRQLEELGFVANHADEKIISLLPDTQEWIGMDELIASLPDASIELAEEGKFTPDDATYAGMVQNVIDNEIGKGEGCNFVMARHFTARFKSFGHAQALSCFKRILANEYGYYWAFVFFTGDRYFISATPERHISSIKGNVKMNPISGTFRKTDQPLEAAMPALQSFLRNPKEMFELLMVTDEELKMMAEVCSQGGQVVGPLLKEMSKLIHTEYVLAGQSEQDVVDILRKSMFAATMVGGPIENACRVVQRNEKATRRYYSSALALIGRDAEGVDTLDSPITIRTAEIGVDGRINIGVGATIVRNSIPKEETAETYAKAAGVMKAFGFAPAKEVPAYRLGEQVYCEDAMAALSSRNSRLSRFWIEDQNGISRANAKLVGKKVTIVDNEDNFVKMMGHLIRALGAEAKIVRYDAYDRKADDADIVLLGPGPGDPSNLADPKMARIANICRDLLASKTPLFCVCLGHQFLCQELGFPLQQKRVTTQGVQSLIDLWGHKEYVGFYNAFTGKTVPGNKGLEVSFDESNDEIHALKGGHFVGVQFHPESILTTNGLRIVEDILVYLAK